MMSGSDLSPQYYLDPYWGPRTYAHQLAALLECPTDDSYRLIECMRAQSWERILDLQKYVTPEVRMATPR